MQLAALSLVEDIYSHPVFWSICPLATTTWTFFHCSLTSFRWPMYFDRSYNATQRGWIQGLVNSACIAVATTTTVSVAHIIWYYYVSRNGLPGAVFFRAHSYSCLITCTALISGWNFLNIRYKHGMKPASKRSKSGSQILYNFLLTYNWFIIHDFLTQANNNDIGGRLISEFLYFNIYLATFAFWHDVLFANTYLGILSWV